jgi:protein-arginine kinase
LEIEAKVKKALSQLDGELAGTYKSLAKMSAKDEKKLIEEHILFKISNKFFKSAGGYADWPIGRGIFINKTKTFIVWVNEEDHIRIVSMQQGANLREVWERLVKVSLCFHHSCFWNCS